MTLAFLMTLLGPLLNMALPLVVGFLTNRITDLLKLASTVLDGAPTWIKQGLVVVISGLLVLLGNWLGVTVSPDAVGAGLSIDKTTLEALIAGVFAMVLHTKKVSQQNRDKINEVLPEFRSARSTSNPFDIDGGKFDPGA